MSLIYVGDYRLHLHRIMRFANGLKGHVFEVTFEIAMYPGTARHRHLTVAIVQAIWRTYRMAYRKEARETRRRDRHASKAMRR